MEERHQTLVIKAANGKFEDFQVDSLCSWTIKHLKDHISNEHPSRPAVSCQKLICAGKLLADDQLVRDIASESGNSPVVLHLVMYERSLSAPASVTKQSPVVTKLEGHTEEILEQGGSVDQGQEQATPGQENPVVSQGPRFRGAYTQWMPGVIPYGGIPGYGTYPLPQGYMPPYNPVLAAHMIQWYQYYNGRQLSAEAENGEHAVNEDEDIQIIPDQPEAPEVEENAVAMNAGIGGMDAANMQRRRDVVDYLYMLMMAVFLGTMAFMTGSLGRFLIFAGGVVFMLLNQAGWFSVQRRRQDRSATAPAAPPIHPAQPPPPAPPPTLPTVTSQQPTSSNSSQDNSSSQPPDGTQSVDHPIPAPAPVPPPQPGLLVTVFVFFTSFFASLIPQHHQPMGVN